MRYLAEITETVRGYHARTEELAAAARRVQRLDIVQGELVEAGEATDGVGRLLESARKALPHDVRTQIQAWPAVVASSPATSRS